MACSRLLSGTQSGGGCLSPATDLAKSHLYYGIFNGKLIFGSEIKALLAHPDVEVAVNREALDNYLTFDCVPAPFSIFDGIFKIAAGAFADR